MDGRPPRPPSGEWNTKAPQTIDRAELYRKLSRISDIDALHSLIAAHGAEILDKGLPYVLIATRNLRRSEHRRSVAHSDVTAASIQGPVSLWDPYQQLEHTESLQRVTSALSELDDEDVLVVWKHAEGYSDTEIQQEWDVLGFEPRAPTVEYLRKRRQRARERLKKLLAR